MAEMRQLAHYGRRYAVQPWLGKENDGFNAGKSTVDVGLLALELKVAHRAHAFDDELGAEALGKVDSEVAVLLYADTWLVAIERTYSLNALIGAEHIALALVNTYAYHKMVEQGEGAAHDGVMAYGEWVERPDENSYTFHRSCFVCKSNVFLRKHVAFSFFCLMRQHKYMVALGGGGGEDVGVAAVVQLQTLAQFGHGQGEVAHGDVGLLHTGEGLAELSLVHSGDGIDGKCAAGEIFFQFVGKKQMTVTTHCTNTIGSGYLVETASLHHGSVGLV